MTIWTVSPGHRSTDERENSGVLVTGFRLYPSGYNIQRRDTLSITTLCFTHGCHNIKIFPNKMIYSHISQSLIPCFKFVCPRWPQLDRRAVAADVRLGGLMPLLCRVPRLPPTRNLNWIALHSSAEL